MLAIAEWWLVAMCGVMEGARGSFSHFIYSHFWVNCFAHAPGFTAPRSSNKINSSTPVALTSTSVEDPQNHRWGVLQSILHSFLRMSPMVSYNLSSPASSFILAIVVGIRIGEAKFWEIQFTNCHLH
jgi:hypothetical protein